MPAKGRNKAGLSTTRASKPKRKTVAATKTKTGTARRKASKSARSVSRPAAKRSSAKSAGSSRNADAIALLTQDHQEVKELFKRYKSLGDRAHTSKGRLVGKMIRELSIHAALEEQLLYPVVRTSLPDGDSLVEEALREHREAKETLAELDKIDPEDHGFDVRVKTLIEEVDHHVREEEQEMFPKFRKSIERGTLVEIGDRMRMLKKIAPTRPHPHAPQTPPTNVVTGLIASVVDRVRDVRDRMPV